MEHYAQYPLPILGTPLLDALSVTAITSTVGSFLCGIPICQGIISRGTADSTPAAPFVLGTIGCFFWLRYGFMRHDNTIIVVNGIGLALEVAYLALYWHYCVRKSGINRQIIAIMMLSIGMFYYTSSTEDQLAAVEHLGKMCVIINVLNFASPLAGLRDVFRTKTTATIPFALCCAGLAVSAQWFLYGVFVNDIYMKFPNAIGIGLSIFQLSLFLIYPSGRPHGG